MAIFKCKMCGGDLDINEASTVAECIYCGTQQTLPKLDDDRKANLYDRANHFRRNNDFDKAMGIYEQILNTDTTDAEAYWSLVLCHYGIEYVEDPATHKRVPTVNRAQFTSIFDDANYKSALEYADASQKQIYENEAKAINEIQKGILAISQNEEPFDVFICYKETDANGRRTPDSVLANDLYHQLTQEGFKVFFSRITLEDKLGTAYEPYIFAALNSSTVMVVLGTKPEYFNAVWVKNEWSRYLTLIKSGANKILIPAYKDMDPYDLPEEFSHLQAQDMSKLGFMQDLIRGIKKLTRADEPKTTVVKETVVTSANNTAALLKRAFMFLEDGDWTSANEYCEKVLDLDPECADAYLGKLMADLKVKKQDNLKNCSGPFDKNNNYQKALRFADDKLKAKLKADIEYIKERNENARLDGIYNSGYAIYNSDTTESEYKRASSIFAQIPQYKDAEKLSKECLKKAETARKDSILDNAKSKLATDEMHILKSAISLFESIKGFKDADELLQECKAKIQKLEEKAEAERLEREQKAESERKKAETKKKLITKISVISVASICLVIAVAMLINTVILPAVQLNRLKKSISDVGVGDSIYFGYYEQDALSLFVKEPIEWRVLDVEDDKMFVLSEYVLDCQPVYLGNDDYTWETSDLRKWLNSNFVSKAFNKKGEKLILDLAISESVVSFVEHDDYENSEETTTDKVFLLSYEEMNKYLKDTKDRECIATKYAEKQGVHRANNGNCYWWLRTNPDNRKCRTINVDYLGVAANEGEFGTAKDIGVRPAMWIELK
ncbi:MAG: TIR domain-containing protein [Ruminococcus sp.]|nr:TIR domain-containing protein [Ruminococcus sp.]